MPRGTKSENGKRTLGEILTGKRWVQFQLYGGGMAEELILAGSICNLKITMGVISYHGDFTLRRHGAIWVCAESSERLPIEVTRVTLFKVTALNRLHLLVIYDTGYLSLVFFPESDPGYREEDPMQCEPVNLDEARKGV